MTEQTGELTADVAAAEQIANQHKDFVEARKNMPPEEADPVPAGAEPGLEPQPQADTTKPRKRKK